MSEKKQPYRRPTIFPMLREAREVYTGPAIPPTEKICRPCLDKQCDRCLDCPHNCVEPAPTKGKGILSLSEAETTELMAKAANLSADLMNEIMKPRQYSKSAADVAPAPTASSREKPDHPFRPTYCCSSSCVDCADRKGLHPTTQQSEPSDPIIGYDTGKEDGTAIVRGHKDDDGNLVITDMQYYPTPSKETEQVVAVIVQLKTDLHLVWDGANERAFEQATAAILALTKRAQRELLEECEATVTDPEHRNDKYYFEIGYAAANRLAALEPQGGESHE